MLVNSVKNCCIQQFAYKMKFFFTNITIKNFITQKCLKFFTAEVK